MATDEVGRQLGEKTVKATTAGHATAIMWAREQFGLELIWGIEDCRNMSARLERDLLAAGQQVVRVPTKLMAQTRKSARSRGKSDPIDALAVARAVLRETDLPLATHDETSRELKLLTDRRDVLVAQRTSAINRLRWLVHELDPERAPAARSLDAAKHQQALRTWLDTQPGLVAELARAELTDIIRLTGEINTLAQRISARVHQVAPALLEIPGCAELTAAKIVGEAAGVTRFKSEAAFACHAAVAPIPVWSGNTAGQMRLSRSGNRQLNAALHRIALTQIRMTDSRGQAYYQRLQDAGKTKRAALRCLKRRLARTVFQALRTVQRVGAPASKRMSGQRPSTAVAVGNDPANAVHTSGNAYRANDINRRQDRFASITAPARRITDRRNANCAGVGSVSGVRSNTSLARVRTSASMTSDLLLPTIAPRSRAQCRAPAMCMVSPAFSTAIVSGSHVIEVGSTVASISS